MIGDREDKLAVEDVERAVWRGQCCSGATTRLATSREMASTALSWMTRVTDVREGRRIWAADHQIPALADLHLTVAHAPPGGNHRGFGGRRRKIFIHVSCIKLASDPGGEPVATRLSFVEYRTQHHSAASLAAGSTSATGRLNAKKSAGLQRAEARR